MSSTIRPVDLLNSSKSGGPRVTIYSDCVIDCHMHVMSGYCTPLPLLWKSIPFEQELSRDQLNFMASQDKVMEQIDKKTLDQAKATAKVQSPSPEDDDTMENTLQACRTESIAVVAVLENQKSYSEKSTVAQSEGHRSFFDKLWAQDTTKKRGDFKNLFTPMITMTMDMEYAHIAGFERQPIYHEENGDVTIFRRESFFQNWEDIRRDPLPVSKESIRRFKKWIKQKKSHESAAANAPWSILPFYHYEPRRWHLPSKTELLMVEEPPLLDFGCWDTPFKSIASRKHAKQPGIFLGFKMYPPLGYSPAEKTRLPHLSKFYLKCIQEDIPILSHCSLGGMTTHEYNFYIENETSAAQKKTWSKKLGAAAKTPEMAYFENACVHPRHWETVLKRPGHKNLRLCLAHFGGKIWQETGINHDWIQTIIRLLRHYPNVYTDISCFDIAENEKNFITMLKNPEYRDIHKKILFGTDWYMTLMSRKTGGIQQHYQDFVRNFKLMLDYNGLQHLWAIMTLVNPVRYLGLTNMVVIDNVYQYLQKANPKPDSKSGYERMKSLGAEIAKIRTHLNLAFGEDYLP